MVAIKEHLQLILNWLYEEDIVNGAGREHLRN